MPKKFKPSHEARLRASDIDEIKSALEQCRAPAAKAALATLAERCQAYAGKHYRARTAKYHEQAMRQSIDGEVEVDPDATVSESDTGAYVQAWMWVSNDDLK
jgi:hypothetical protein